MAKTVRFLAALCALVSLTSGAFAQQRQRSEEPLPGDRKPIQQDARQKREAAPLLYALPDLQSNDVLELELRIVQGKHTYAKQRVTIAPYAPAGATIDVLATHPQELTKLRKLETEKPGSLRFLVAAGERLLADEPFAAVDAGSAKLSLDSAIGSLVSVAIDPAPKTRLQTQGMYRDPECMSWCDMQFNSCMEWCDPRGSDCNLCYTWYNDCSIPCPWVCYDPKSVTTHETRTATSVYTFNSRCHSGFFGNQRWDQVSVTYRVDVWERTTNCDDSYTDRFLYSYNTSQTCWYNTGYSCSFPSGSPGYPRC
ncbi:MAG TPA: hypothetical protein VF618_10440 [Thermoanaerobaculia bacterium]